MLKRIERENKRVCSVAQLLINMQICDSLGALVVCAQDYGKDWFQMLRPRTHSVCPSCSHAHSNTLLLFFQALLGIFAT